MHAICTLLNVAKCNNAKESTICRENGRRLGAKVHFHLADRRLLAFNYVYGSVYEPDEGERIGGPRVRGSGIPRRACVDSQRAPPVTQRPAVCVCL